jgi:hypothetical protein
MATKKNPAGKESLRLADRLEKDLPVKVTLTLSAETYRRLNVQSAMTGRTASELVDSTLRTAPQQWSVPMDLFERSAKRQIHKSEDLTQTLQSQPAISN